MLFIWIPISIIDFLKHNKAFNIKASFVLLLTHDDVENKSSDTNRNDMWWKLWVNILINQKAK